MSSDGLVKEETDLVISTLLKCAVVLGYEPKPSDFSGRTSTTIRRLTKFIIQKLGVEKEVEKILGLATTLNNEQ